MIISQYDIYFQYFLDFNSALPDKILLKMINTYITNPLKIKQTKKTILYNIFQNSLYYVL